MKRSWLYAIVGLGMVAAIVVAARMARSDSAPAIWDLRYPEVAQARALMTARTDSVRAWAAAVLRARTLSLAASAARGPAPFALETRGDISDATRETFAADFARELATIPTPRVPLRVLLVADTTGMGYAGWYLRPRAEGDACTIVIYSRRSRTRADTTLPTLRRLGVCGLYARHGMPGPGIAAWLDRTGAANAISDTTTPRTEARIEAADWPLTFALMSIPAPFACTAGRVEACEAAMLEPLEADVRQRVDLDVAREPRLSGHYAYQADRYPGDVTASLRESLGAADFERWWKSASPPAEAYEALRGEPFARWAQRHLQQELGARKPGPLRAGLPLGLGVGLMLLLVFASLRFVSRQRS